MLVNYLTNCMQCTIEKCNEITSILNNADDLVDVLFCNFGSAGIDLSLIKLEEARYDICAFNTNTGSSKIMNSGITDTAALSDGIDTVVHMIEDFKAKKGVNKDLLIDTQKFVKNLQRDQNDLKSVTKNKLTYLMHDILKIVGPQKPGDTFSTHASSGSKKIHYVRVINRHNNTENTTRKEYEDSLLIANFAKLISSSRTKNETKTKWVNIECQYKRSKYKRIVKSQKDQFKLKMAGGMTDRSWLRFCRELKKISRYTIHHGLVSMNNYLADQIPDFTSGKINVMEKEKICERRCFRVHSIYAVLCWRLQLLYQNGLFLPSQVFSLIDNDRIILKFGGDKGGKTLKTKFGVTIMNTPLSNSVDAFDLIAAVDSEDSYHNLKVGIFDFYRRDLSALFDDNKPLSMLVIIDSDHIPIYCCVHNSEAFDPSIFVEAKYVTLATESADENPLDRFSDYEHSTNDVLMLTNLNRFVRILLIDGIHIHGFCVVNDQDEITKTMLFSKVISVNEWKKCVVKSHKVHSVLSGDIAFICNIVGTQGCSASYPCYMCKVKLSDLRRRNSHVGEPRIMNEISSQATIVQSEKNVTLKKKKAIQNDSVLNFPLFDLQISQIMIPVLHIVLGIVKKMWDNLLKEIQALDGTEKEQVNFKRVMDLICVMIEANKKDLVSKEEDVKLHEESLQNTIDDYHFALQECAFDHENESIKAFKSNINEMKEVVNESKLLAESAAKIIPATNTALDDLMKGVESFSH